MSGVDLTVFMMFAFGWAFFVQYKVFPELAAIFGVDPANPRSLLASALIRAGGCSFCVGFWSGLSSGLALPFATYNPLILAFASAGFVFFLDRLSE